MKRHEAQPRLGLKVGDKVTPTSTFYAGNTGTILSFLDQPSAANNGAALVDIVQQHGQRIRVFIDTKDLTRRGTGLSPS